MPRPSTSNPPHVALYTFFRGGGIGLYTVELIRRLARTESLKLTLFCSTEFEWQEIEGVKVDPVMMALGHRLPVIRRARFLAAQWINPRRLIRKVREEGIQIVHFSSYNSLTYPAWGKALRKSGAKFVVSAHDVLRQKAILCRSWEERQLAAFYNDADAILVHSSFQAEQLEAFANVSPERVHLVPHGPYDYPRPIETKEELRSKYRLPRDAFIALFFGRIRDEKNLERLLNAWPQDQPLKQLVVAGKAGGKHKPLSYYQTLCRELGISDQVTFIDRFMDEPEVGRLFTLADCLALPYGASFLSQSGVLNIAAAFDLPVLVGEAPVPAETVADSAIGCVAPNGDLRAGIDAILDFAQGDHSAAFEQYRETFTWEQNAKITASVYRRLLD